MQKEIKVILFDLDGTLLDSAEAAFECGNALSEKYNYDKRDDWDGLKSLSAHEMFFKVLKLKWYQIPFYLRDARQLFVQKIESVHLFPKIKESLETLAKHYSIGIMTSNGKETVRRILEREGIDMLDYVITDLSVFSKGRALKKFIKKHKLNSHDVCYVGDETRDFDASQKANVSFIGVSWGFNNRTFMEEQGVQTIVDTPKQLVMYFQK